MSKVGDPSLGLNQLWDPDLSYGRSADKFGHQDYIGNLKDIWDANTPGEDRQKKLMDYRRNVLDWMGREGNINKIHESNRLGVEGGLGAQIASGALTHRMPGVGNPGGKDWIGHADLMAARAAGHSWEDFLSYLDSNPDKLQGSNPKGKGGLYDQVATEVRFEGERSDWRDSFDSVTDQMTASQAAFETGLQSVSDAIKAQTASTEKYQSQQDVWRRRQENMQQLQMQESRRARKDKPVIAVMPGSSSYGGGGGGAGAFARKKKQTTGLNIA
tara:strand:+ start:13 stop:828 length:816 start_codon:yes stop_codon:yes gene_type:complete